MAKIINITLKNVTIDLKNERKLISKLITIKIIVWQWFHSALSTNSLRIGKTQIIASQPIEIVLHHQQVILN